MGLGKYSIYLHQTQKETTTQTNNEPVVWSEPQRVEYSEISRSSAILDILLRILLMVSFTLLFTMIDFIVCLIATPVLMNINGIPLNMNTYQMVMTYLYTTDPKIFYGILIVTGVLEFWWGFDKFEDTWI